MRIKTLGAKDVLIAPFKYDASISSQAAALMGSPFLRHLRGLLQSP
jgi:hypothetical protein